MWDHHKAGVTKQLVLSVPHSQGKLMSGGTVHLLYTNYPPFIGNKCNSKYAKNVNVFSLHIIDGGVLLH